MPGYPIRTPWDHSSVDSSPRPIAASHVLHRLLVPRHPPCALSNLTTKMLASTVQFSTNTQPTTHTTTTNTHQGQLCSQMMNRHPEHQPLNSGPVVPSGPNRVFKRHAQPHQRHLRSHHTRAEPAMAVLGTSSRCQTTTPPVSPPIE